MMLVRKTLGYLRWLLVLLPACVYIPVETSPYRGFDREFEAGESTREQIIDVLGVPNLDRQDYRYMLYEWESDGIYIAHPIIMCGNVPPAGNVEGFTRDVLLMEFDDDGVLVRSKVVRNPEGRWTDDRNLPLLIDRFAQKLPLQEAAS